MSRYAIKFPFRVRIHGGEFDESARAIHREDGLKTIQAESGIVLESTIERKQMSTKTTFKRIALVTVAALGFGVMSVAPSSAAVLNPTFTLSAATTTVQLGDEAKVTLTTAGFFGVATSPADTATSTIALATFPTGSTTASLTAAAVVTIAAVDTDIANTVTTSNGQVVQGASDGIIGPNSSAASLISGRTTFAVTPTVAGTYTYTIKSYIAGTATTPLATQTWTVIVNPVTLSSTSVFIGADAVLTADAAATALTAASAAAAPAVAKIQTIQYRTGTTKIQGTSSKTVVFAVSGAGLLGSTNGAAARGSSITVAGGVNGDNNVYLHADGRSGTSTITVIVDGTLVATKTFTFLGALATLTATASKKNVGVGETMTLTAAGTDVNKNATATPTVTAVSSDATIASVTASGAVATVTGVKAGTATITLTDGTITTTAVVTVLPVTAKTLAWAFDKDAYEAGEKMTLTITAAGVADGARAAFVAAPSANFNVAVGSDTLVGSPVFAAGVATYTLYAPANPGKFTLTATVGSAIDTEAVIIAAAGTRTVATLSATVTNPALDAAQEATDAALEAIDAGIAAKDAADQAVEAADAATIAAQDAAAAAELAGEVAVAAAEAAGEIATEALDAANAATEAALSAAEAADAATEAATEAKEAAEAATAAVAALSAEVTKLMAALTAKVTTLSTLVAKIAKKVKA
jgi:hypothetical protein